MKKVLLLLLLFSCLQVTIRAQNGCASAVLLTPGTEQCGNSAGLTGDFPNDGTAPTNPCDDFYNDDEYWFSYTAGVNGELLSLNLDSIDMTYAGLFVFDTCPVDMANCVAFATNSSTTDPLVFTTPGLDAGKTYYIAIINWGAPDNTSFCLNSAVLPPPPKPACPVILSPPNGAVDVRPVDVNTFFILDPVTTEYYFMAGDSPGTLDTFYIGVNDMDTIFDFPDFPFYDSTFYWQIIPYNSTGATGGCEIRSFTTIALQDPPANSGVTCTEGVLAPIATEEFSSSLPNGWTGDIATGTTAGLWHPRTGTTPSSGSGTGPSGANSGDYYLYFESSAGTDTASTITPAYDLSGSTDGVELEFYAHMFGSAMGNMVIDATSDTTGGGVWTNLGTLAGPHQAATTDPWEVARYDVTSFNGGNLFIRFTAQPFDMEPIFLGDMAIDDVSIKACQSCITPSDLVLNSTTINSLTISWTENGSATLWDLYYGFSGIAPPNSGTVPTENDVNNNSMYQIKNLMQDSTYDIYVRADCGGGDESFWFGPLTAKVPGPGETCGSAIGISVQVACDTSNDTEIDFSTTSPVEYTSCDATGTNYGRWFSFVAPATGNIDIITTSTSSSEMALFDACGGNEIYCIATTSTLDRTITGLTPGNTYYLLVWEDTSTPVTSFCVQAGSACQPLSGLVATNLTSSSADLSWNGNASSTGFVIEYGPDGFALGSGTQINTGTIGGPVTIPGLMQNTAYDAYVWEICGGSATDTIGPTLFNTLCGVQSADYCQGWEALSATAQFNGSSIDCWFNVNSSEPEWRAEDLTTGSSNTGPSGPYLGSRYVYFEASGGSVGDSDTLTGPEVDISGLTNPEFIFYYFMYGVDIGSLYWEVSDDGGSSWNNLGTLAGQQQTSPGDDWIQISEDLSSFGNTVLVRFIGVRSSGSFAGDIAIDEVCIREMPSCFAPTDVIISNETGDGADVSWTENGSATNWAVEVVESGMAQGTGTISLASGSPMTSLSGLMQNTLYDVYVRAICGAGDSSNWADPEPFATLCAVQVAEYCQGFELFPAGAMSGSPIDCWRNENTANPVWTAEDFGTVSSSTGPSGPYLGDRYIHLETSSPAVEGESDTLTGPSVDVSGLGTAELSFFYHMYGQSMGTLRFEISDDGGSSWSLLDTIVGEQQTSSSDPWLEWTEDLSSYGSEVLIRFIGIRGNDFYSDMAIDEVCIRELVTCPAPSGVTATNPTSGGADISWTENGSATNWEVEAVESGMAQGTGTVFTASGSPSTTISGLNPLTEYDVYVRSVCGAGDTSIWSAPATFMTACAPLVPYYLSPLETAFPVCWDEADAGDIASGPMDIGFGSWLTDDFGNVSGGPNMISAKINAFVTHSDWLITPEFDLSGGDYAVTFDVAATEYNSSTLQAVWPVTDTMYLLATADGGTTWDVLTSWTSANIPSVAGDSVGVLVTSYTGTTQFAFYYTTGGIDSPEDIEIFVDNFEVKDYVAGPCGSITIDGTPGSGTYQAGSITSDALIESPNVVIFKAETDINLIEEFEVELGAEFDAMIEDCP